MGPERVWEGNTALKQPPGEMQASESIPAKVKQHSAQILQYSCSAACTVVSVTETDTGSSCVCTTELVLVRGTVCGPGLIPWYKTYSDLLPLTEYPDLSVALGGHWVGVHYSDLEMKEKKLSRVVYPLIKGQGFKGEKIKSCLPAQLCKLRRGESFFKELDGLLSYPWSLPSPFPPNADAKISLKQHKGQTIIKTFHHIALTLSSRGWIHWHSSGSKNSALVPFFRDAVLLALIQKRLQVLREYDSWPKIFVYTRLFKQFSKYFSG